MLKIVFVALVALNVVAFYFGVSSFFVTLAPMHFAGLATPETLGAAEHSGVESMRNFLFPSLKWLVGISLTNLLFAGIVVFRSPRAST